LVVPKIKNNKIIAKPKFIDRTIFTEVHLDKTRIKFNKPVLIGMTILELSTTVMYQYFNEILSFFCYDNVSCYTWIPTCITCRYPL
jgi:hypothetical protein